MNHNQQSSSHLLLLISLVFGAVWVAHGQVPFPGKCPDVKLLDTFDAEAYMGVWYEYAAYPFAFEIGKKCIYANYSLVDNSTVSVVNAAINRFTGQPSNVTGQAKVLGPGQLAVAFFPSQPLTKANYLVLGTDYDSYAVVYSCSSVTPLANFKIVWILTRQREPSAEAVDAARKILEDNDVSQTFLIDTIQRNCPRLDGNGTGLAGEDDLDVDDFVSTTVPNAIEKA